MAHCQANDVTKSTAIKQMCGVGVTYFYLSSEVLGRTSDPEESQDSGVTGAQDAEPGLHPNSLPQYVTGYSLSCTCFLIYKEDRVVKYKDRKGCWGTENGYHHKTV